MRDPADLLARIERLEQHNRRLRLTGTLWLIAVTAVALMGQAGARSAPHVIEAREFVVRDAAGKTRARLGMLSDGGWGLTLVNAEGKFRTGLIVGPGTDANRGGASGVVALDQAGRLRLGLVANAGGPPGLTFTDEGGRKRIRLAITDAQESALELVDRSGHERVTLGVSPENNAVLVLGDGMGTRRVGLAAGANGAGYLAFSTPDGRNHLHVGMTVSGFPSSEMRDESGKVIWRAP